MTTNRGVESSSRLGKFTELANRAAECTVCPRMKSCRAILGPANGPLNAKILFVAEAPGRFGAGKTGIPFKGDRSGENFEILLKSAGLTRTSVFITNAVLCLPLKNGTNDKPSSSEIKNCSSFLKATLDLIKPRVVVSLGRVGLDALNWIFGTRYTLAKTAAHLQSLSYFNLFPLYHPSPRVIYRHRSMAQQKKDFKKIVTFLDEK